MEIEGPAQLVVDEELFLSAIHTLSELEDQGERFELHDAADRFERSSYVASRFAADTGREIKPDDTTAIYRYIVAVWFVEHDHADLGDIGDIRDQYDGPPLDFIRSAAWAFLTAWTMRYGGLAAYKRVPATGTVVDPKRMKSSRWRPM